MKAAIYCRVSTAEQTTENQKIRLIEYAKAKGWKYDVYEEVESSRKARPVKAKLLERLRRHEYDAVLIYKLDRWARSSTELILESRELIEKGMGFISISENLDFSTAAGKLHFQILSAFAEFERELIRERTIEGLKRTKQHGTKLGRPSGSKDREKRKRSGYLLREALKRKSKDERLGIFHPVESYMHI
jgi:putative DNA-invertase from lambdoid prophage Rac